MYNIGCITISAQGEKRPEFHSSTESRGGRGGLRQGGADVQPTTELQRELGASPSGERRRMTQVKLSPSLF